MPAQSDPIAAIATAPGRGGIGVVRLSGGELEAYIQPLTGKALTLSTPPVLLERDAISGISSWRRVSP